MLSLHYVHITTGIDPNSLVVLPFDWESKNNSIITKIFSLFLLHSSLSVHVHLDSTRLYNQLTYL
jgi:hypothetical protein